MVPLILPVAWLGTRADHFCAGCPQWVRGAQEVRKLRWKVR